MKVTSVVFDFYLLSKTAEAHAQAKISKMRLFLFLESKKICQVVVLTIWHIRSSSAQRKALN
jgi:hypothetical protein